MTKNYYLAYGSNLNLYEKEYISAKTRFRKYKGLIYVMNDDFSYYYPDDSYVKICEGDYENFGFDKRFLDEALSYSIGDVPKQLRKEM